ncbi:hypothetical protein [Kurthia sibirica]|uniref:Uncharacterized protein n=1 Tax=Kurthia sibirica TaxID=202750 RepID=A0A2U3AP33_9BACL|nr:hypothetical protein [Kurthia sibirica]PWI26308.1 hypothetical protein DEX24_02945 [Kurthia sibirica]GEK35023.1 hypothetical protein KSI01_25560 [Kurthia sibirica]
MSKEIINFVELIKSQLLMDLSTKNVADLESIANHLIARHKTDMRDICQAYEVVKHSLIG